MKQPLRILAGYPALEATGVALDRNSRVSTFNRGLLFHAKILGEKSILLRSAEFTSAR